MGLSDPTAVLDAITATVDERCACGCGAPLAGSASAWFAGPECQRRWQAARTDGELRDGGLLAGAALPGWAFDQAGPAGGTVRAGEVAAQHERQQPASAHYRALPDGGLVRLVVHDPHGLAREGYELGAGLAGPAAWMAEVARVQRALGRGVNLPPEYVFEYDTTPLVERVGQAFAGLRAGLEMYAEAVTAVVAGVGRTVRWLEEHRLLDPPGVRGEPTDPRERALWLRRNRNTGPARPVRAPRRIDPRGGAPRR